MNAVSRPAPDSTYFWARATFELYAENTDPLLVANPEWLRAMTLLSSFLFGPFYVVLVLAFIKGWNGIRPWALLYAGMILESMFILLFVEFRGEAELFSQIAAQLKPDSELGAAGITASLKATNIPKVLAFYLPYVIAPALLAIRMWRPGPFSDGRVRERDL